MDLSEAEAFSCLRFSLGRFNTESDITATVLAVERIVKELRAMVA